MNRTLKAIVIIGQLYYTQMILLVAIVRHLNGRPIIQINKRSIIFIPGDIYLGGLFPVHQAPSDHSGLCGQIKSGRGIQRLEAMLFSLDMLNKNKHMLAKHSELLAKSKNKYGAIIYDTCDFDSYGVDAAMQFAMSRMFPHLWLSALRDQHLKRVSAVIGAASSEVSVSVAHVLRMAEIPQVSYASTSSELSNRVRFKFFSRVVPADNMQASVMASIISEMGWTYIAIVKESGNYGERFAEDLKNELKKTNSCIATEKTIPTTDDRQRYMQVLEELHSEEDLRNVKVVVIFAQEDLVRKLLRYTTLMNLTNRWIWLSSDAWGYKPFPVSDYEIAALNAITIAPTAYRVKEFDDYFHNLNPYNHSLNPWFKEYWEREFKCQIRDTGRNEGKKNYVSEDRSYTGSRADEEYCRGDEMQKSISKVSQESFVHFVIDAVFTVVIAIETIMNKLCENGSYCEKFNSVSGERLQNEIRKVSFQSVSGRQVSFNHIGNGVSSYDIFQFQSSSENKYEYRRIGTYQLTNGKYRVNLDGKIIFWDKTGGKKRENWKLLKTVPQSFCQEQCASGVIKINERNKCCWTCKPCPMHYIAINGTRCVECVEEMTANSNQTTCIKMIPQYLKFQDPISIFTIIFASIGVLSNLFLFGVFIRYSNTPIIKASARELCYVLLTGMMACYLMSFSLVAKPSMLACSVNRFGVSVSLSMCLSALLTKTNRISRIFNCSAKSLQKKNFVSPRSQLLICFSIISFQVIALIIWLVLKPPKTNKVVDYFRGGKRLILTCDSDSDMIVVSLLYNMMMVVCCTVYAFKTRKIPENFNEAKYIGFTMYSVCIVWMAFIAIYFGVASSEDWFRIQMAAIAVCLTLSAYVITGCLFVPKVYIVLFQPRKNIKRKPNITKLMMRADTYDATITEGQAPINENSSEITTVVETRTEPSLSSIDNANNANVSGCGVGAGNVPATSKAPRVSLLYSVPNVANCTLDLVQGVVAGIDSNTENPWKRMKANEASDFDVAKVQKESIV